jgi:Zn-dependent protease
VFLLEPQPTPADLQFRIFGTPVRVHPMFWLVSALLGWHVQRELGFVYLLIWILCVFVSILVHELGHIWMGRFFGSDGHIVLFSFGGLAIGSKNLPNRWQRILVSAAGPLIQFIPFGLVWLIWIYQREIFGMDVLLGRAGTPIRAALHFLWWINLWWPLLNLLPIWPLDGGQIARELFDYFMPGRGIRTALGVSMLVAGSIAAHALLSMNRGKPIVPYLPDDFYGAVLFGLLAFSNYQEMQQLGVTNPWGREGAPWERDPDSWRR